MIFANVNLKRCVKPLPHFFQNRANYIAGAEDTADAESALAHTRRCFTMTNVSPDVLILRDKWLHGIAARKMDEWKGQKYRRECRVSLTFRNVIIE